MIRQVLLSTLVLLSITACATSPRSAVQTVEKRIAVPDVLPDKLGEQGVLVATIAADSISTSKLQRLSFSLAGVQIDRTYYSNAVRDNYLVLPLAPGEYTLEALHVYRDTDDRAATLYPLKYKFQISSRQATNLGTLVLLRIKDTPRSEGRYLKVPVDNTAEMQAHLRKHHPKLVAELRSPVPVLNQETKFMQPHLMETLRRDLARESWLWLDEPNRSDYVGGEVGTIAKFLRDTRGKIAAVDVLDSGTTSPMRSCSDYQDRFVCSSAEPALYSVADNKIVKRNLPVAADQVWVHVFPPRGLALMDQNMNIYVSSDNGGSWKKYVWFQRTKPLHYLTNIHFTNGKNGYYIYSTFTVDPLAPKVLYSDFVRGGFSKIDIPDIEHWQRLIETSQGLLLGPKNTVGDKERAKLYFRPLSGSAWQSRPLPGKSCFYLRHTNRTDDQLDIFCDGKSYRSADSGNSWNEIVSEK